MWAESMTRTDALAAELSRCGFSYTADALWRGDPVPPGAVLRMLRWAVGYYREERATMAHALRLGKTWAREVRGARAVQP